MSRIFWLVIVAAILVVVGGALTVGKRLLNGRPTDTAAEHASEPAAEPAGRANDPAAPLGQIADDVARAQAAASQAGAAAGVAATAAQRLAEVQSIADTDSGNTGRLMKAIVDWSAEPQAVEARRQALGSLMKASPAPLARVSSLVAIANAAAPGAIGKDPLFPDLQKAAKEAWSTDTIQSGRDMMLAESNPNARQLLASSLAEYAASERGLADLSPGQKNGLRSDFIDVYGQMPDAQKKQLENAVAKMAGAHAAELLRGLATTP